MVFVNAFAGRATKPVDLWKMDDPIGPENMAYIAQVAAEVQLTGGFFVFAWGAVNPPTRMRGKVYDHLRDVQDTVYQYCADMRCLGLTKSGDPRHPLYLAANTPLRGWGCRPPRNNPCKTQHLN